MPASREREQPRKRWKEKEEENGGTRGGYTSSSCGDDCE